MRANRIASARWALAGFAPPTLWSEADWLLPWGPEANTNWTNLLVTLVLVAATLCGLVLLGLLVAAGQRQRRMSPRRLFIELCQAHQLSWNQRQLLAKLAAEQQLTNPCQLFLDRARFEHFSPALQPYQAQLVELRRRLFG